jgi:uncharacterized protein (DUF983 family)
MGRAEMTTYTTCPSCGSSYPIGNQHDCPTHIKPLVIVVATVLFLLLVGFSCNIKIEIKQKPADSERVEK